MEGCSLKPRDASSQENLEGAGGGFSSRASGGGVTLPTLGVQSSETDFRLLASRTVRE